MTFNSLPAYQKAGDIASAGEFSEYMGYDPVRHWKAGDFPADVFTLGDFQSSLDTQELNLDQISQLSGLDLEGLRIADVPFLQNKTLSEVIKAVPALEGFTLEEIPAIAEVIDFDLSSTLGEMIGTDELLGELNFSELVGDFSIMEIPNLDLVEMSAFQDWEASAISEIPGLGDIGFGKLSQIPDIFSGVTATHDVTYGPKEHTRTPTKNSITGSNIDGFSVQCVQPRGCAHIELTGSGNMHGAQWIAGGSKEGQQIVNGGEGVLGVVNGGKEPTGRLPFGDTIKIVLDSVSESKGTAEFALYFRYCYRGMPDLGCTPYFLGPIPMPVLNSKEKGMVITGFLDALGGISSGIAAPKAWEKLKPAAPQEVNDILGRYKPRRGGGGLCGDGPGGVSFEALAGAFSSIEGNYNSVGYPTNGGYGLGRYQYMTYREDVRASIQQRPGGEDFLRRADGNANAGIRNGISTADVEQYFPAADQDALFKNDQTRNIEQAVAEGFTGDRIIERVGQIHYGGPRAPIDGNWYDTHERLTLKTYGEELASTYKSVAASGGESTCQPGGLIAGKSVEEAIAYEQAWFQDFDAYRAYRNGYHAGIDFDYRFGAGEGGEVTSLLGGEVIKIYPIAENKVTREGSMTVIVATTDSDGRSVELLYTHLSESSVSSSVQIGSTISPGQSIGLVGGDDTVSNGAHLDLKVMVNGVYVDPDEFMQAVLDGGGTLTTIDVATGAQGTTQVGGF